MEEQKDKGTGKCKTTLEELPSSISRLSIFPEPHSYFLLISFE
jgi:hypothetical protein